MERDRRVWQRVSMGAALFLFCQGLLLLCILPPLEGMDEYQHLAYIVFLVENGRPPELGKDTVPVSLLKTIADIPQPFHSVEQSASWGTQTYEDYWDGSRKGKPEGQPVFFYQAQHPPLYYWLMTVPYRLAAPFGLQATIGWLRLLNLLFLVLSMALFSRMLGELIKDFRESSLMLILTVTFPLFLVNACRIANDVLAILFGFLSLFFLFRFFYAPSLAKSFWGALFLSLGIWSKSTVLVWGALWGLVFMRQWWRPQSTSFSRGKVWLAGAIFLSVLGVLCGTLFYQNWIRYGSLSSMVELTYASFQQRRAQGLLPVLWEVNWPRELARFLSRIWIGGWSFLKLPLWLEGFYGLTLFSIAALALGKGILLWWSKGVAECRRVWRRNCLFLSTDSVLILLLSVVGVLLGMFYHVFITHATYGVASTNAWYFMIAQPGFFCLLVQALYYTSPQAAKVCCLGLSALFWAIGLWGAIWRMPSFYTHADWSITLWRRLCEMHPWFLHPILVVPSLLISGIVAGRWARWYFPSGRQER